MSVMKNEKAGEIIYFTEEEKEMVFNALGRYLSLLETWHSEEIEGWNYPTVLQELNKKIQMARVIANKIDPNMRYY